MKIVPYFTIFTVILLASCGSSSSSSNTKNQDPHGKMHEEMHSEFQQEQMQKKLDGPWLIAQVNDITIDSSQFDGKTPEMVFDVAKGAFNGNDGCNLFHGTMNFKKDKIVFGPAAGTLMACPNMDTSGKITKSFSEKELTYTLNEVLIFFEGNRPVLMLKRAD